MSDNYDDDNDTEGADDIDGPWGSDNPNQNFMTQP